jgi:hypothetical protein
VGLWFSIFFENAFVNVPGRYYDQEEGAGVSNKVLMLVVEKHRIRTLP